MSTRDGLEFILGWTEDQYALRVLTTDQRHYVVYSVSRNPLHSRNGIRYIAEHGEEIWFSIGGTQK